MASGAGGYDWGKPFKPPGASIWIADHRTLVRYIFFVIDLALVIAATVTLISGEVWWLLLLQVILWGGLTYQAGWLVPDMADRWRGQQDRPS